MIWELTSRACQEQYDIYTSYGLYAAYFRLRHGSLMVHPVKHGEIDWNTILYDKYYYDQRGCFPDDELSEFIKIQRKVNIRIIWYLIKQWFK